MASTKHRVLIVGTGSIGERHLRCFLGTGRVVAGIVEPMADRRNSVAEAYGVPYPFASVEEAMGERWDAAVIASPASAHIPLAQQLAGAGAHLLIEKPLATSTQGVDELAKTIGEKDLAAAVAYVYRAHPALAGMREAISSGRFGKPVELVAVSGQHFPLYRPAYREIYYVDRRTGGGAIQDALTHLFNAAEWLVGPIERICADAAHQVLEGVSVEDTVHALTRHGEVMGSFSLNQHQAPNEVTLTVICERGTVRFEGHRRRWLTMTEPDTDWQEIQVDVPERDALFVVQAHAFLDVLEGKAKPLCTLEEGTQTLEVNLAALKSVEEGRWVTVGNAD